MASTGSREYRLLFYTLQGTLLFRSEMFSSLCFAYVNSMNDQQLRMSYSCCEVAFAGDSEA